MQSVIRNQPTSVMSRDLLAASFLSSILCCTACVSFAAGPSLTDNPALLVKVDPRVELLSIIFRLAGNPEYARGRIEKYTTDVEKHFGPHRDHEVVQMVRKLRQTRGVSYDAVMCLAIHLQDAFTLAERVPLEPRPGSLDRRWQIPETREFLTATRDFVKQTAFREFITSHQAQYESAESRLQVMLKERAHLEWFDQFFGGRPQAQFTVAIGLLNGGNCYGPHVQLADGPEELYCILGAWSTDKNGDPQFDESMLGTVIHEFCHSYANAIVDRHESALKPAGEKIFPRVQAAMQKQAYGNWKTMMYESLVRACTIRYTQRHQGTLAAMKQTLADQQRQFLWMGELVTLLGTYEKQRDQYPTLDEFAPQLVSFFDRYAEKLAHVQADMAAKRPQVVSTTPESGATNVDPALATIQVTFDRPMKDQSWSLVGGGPNFPEITGKPHYDPTRKIWSVPVQLKPNWSYECRLNSDRFTGFQSEDGTVLTPVRLTFKTAEGR